MSSFFETDVNDIERLNPLQLTKLMHCLISNELAASHLPRTDVDVSFSINVPDGGADAIVTLSSATNMRTDHIPLPYTIFQAKSGTLYKDDFIAELFIKGSNRTALKPRIKEAFDNHGAYVVFYSKPCGNKDHYTIAMRKAVLDANPTMAPPPILIIDSSGIAQWCNRHISAVLKVAEFSRHSYLNRLLSWETWSRYDAFRNDFIRSSQTSECISQIKSFIGNANESSRKTSLRISGQSGLGKTRIVLEAFRPNTTTEHYGKPSLAECIAYAQEGNEQTAQTVQELRADGVSGVFIVDNCSESLHETLTNEIRHADSLLHLITLDYHVTRDALRAGEIRIKKSDPKTLVDIVRSGHPNLPADRLDQIVRDCDGYPWIATQYADSPLEAQVTLPKSMIDNIIWGRDKDQSDIKMRVLSALSLFLDVGYDNAVAEEAEYIADKLCAIPIDQFREAVNSFIPRVVKKVGDFVRVSPPPIATRLAQRWYTDTASTIKMTMFSDGLPSRLATARAERFTELPDMIDAKEIARSMMDPNAPFGQAEVLNTELGSQIFRSLSEVDPGSAIAALHREFGSWALEDLQSRLVPGRRNIVWALEKIVFQRDYFRIGMRFLSRLAVAENESIGNNATEIYLQYFQYQLAGTEANYVERIAAADELLEEDDDRFKKLAVRAFGRAIADSSGRTVGAEYQGNRTLQDYHPKTYGEIHRYHRSALVRLASFGGNDDVLSAMARERIARGLRFVVRYTPDALEAALRTVTSSYKRAWPDAVDAVEMTIRYDKERLPNEILSSVNSWLTLLAPQTLEDRVRLTISLAPFGNIIDDDKGFQINVSEQRAEQFADNIKDNHDALREVVRLISSGEQRQAYPFGRRLAQTVDSEDRHEISTLILNCLACARQPNLSLAMGYLSGLAEMDRDAAKREIKAVTTDTRIARFSANLTAIIVPDRDDMIALLPLLEQGQVTVDSFDIFAFGSSVGKLTPTFMAEYFGNFLRYGIQGAQVALQVLSMYLLKDEGQKWAACQAAMRDIVLTPGLFEAQERQQVERYSIEQAVKRILKDAGTEGDFAKKLTEEIIRVCDQPNPPFSAYEVMRPLAVELLTLAQETSWPMFREALGRRKSMIRFHLLHVFEEHVMGGAPKSALLLLDQKAIEDWLSYDPETAATIIARHFPLFEEREQDVVVSPLISMILAEHGKNSFVLSEISANLESFGTIGSMVPSFEIRLRFVRKLIDHPSAPVSSWASNYARSLEKRIESLKRRDEEWKNGITARLPFDDS